MSIQGQSDLEALRPVIDRIFSQASVAEIFQALERETGEWQGWARETLATLAKRSPLSLKVTFEQLRRGKTYRTLKEALIVEYRLATRLVRMPDFNEGVRAVIIDKDQSPRWEPSSLEEVDDTFLQSLFEPLPEGDLKLVDYWGMPAA